MHINQYLLGCVLTKMPVELCCHLSTLLFWVIVFYVLWQFLQVRKVCQIPSLQVWGSKTEISPQLLVSKTCCLSSALLKDLPHTRCPESLYHLKGPCAFCCRIKKNDSVSVFNKCCSTLFQLSHLTSASIAALCWVTDFVLGLILAPFTNSLCSSV